MQASLETKDRTVQNDLIELLLIFKEYTERGKIRQAASIISHQINNLENTAKKLQNIEKQQKTSAQSVKNTKNTKNSEISQLGLKTTVQQPYRNFTNSQPNHVISRLKDASERTKLDYASVAARDSLPEEGWTKVAKAKKATKPQAKAGSDGVKDPLKFKRQATLLASAKTASSDFSALLLRNAFNSAFTALGISKPVILTVSLSYRGNLVLNTTTDFDFEFLAKHSTTLASVLLANQLPSLISLVKNENWAKVLIYRIPIRDFNTPTRIETILEEIKTFNSRFTLVGIPY